MNPFLMIFKLMESGLEQLQQMQNDPDAAREMMKKNMEEFREYCKRRVPKLIFSHGSFFKLV